MMIKIFWEAVSFWGTLVGGIIVIVLGFFLEINFGILMLLNMFTITLCSNTWKIFHFKPRPDNLEGTMPPRPFNPLRFWNFLKPKQAIDYFYYADAGSFPSIHAARAFNQALLLALFFDFICGYFLLLGFAALIAWSRVVKLKHFKIDITAGAIIGIITAASSFWVLNYFYPG